MSTICASQHDVWRRVIRKTALKIKSNVHSGKIVMRVLYYSRYIFPKRLPPAKRERRRIRNPSIHTYTLTALNRRVETLICETRAFVKTITFHRFKTQRIHPLSETILHIVITVNALSV